MSSVKRYLVSSLLVVTMLGLSAATWAAEPTDTASQQAALQQAVAVELTQQVKLQQQQQLAQLQLELQASMQDLLNVEPESIELAQHQAMAE